MTTYNLNNHKQLIDLNGDTINFDITFTVTASDENSTFDVLVVDQTTLDNNPELEYKKATGAISGNLISDKNIYQNYFLILKAENPCSVTVEIDKKEIEPNSMPPKKEIIENFKKSKNVNWRFIIIICVIVGGSILLYSFYKNSQKNGEENVDNLVKSPSPSPIVTSEELPSKGFNFVGADPSDNLINRLNNLSIE